MVVYKHTILLRKFRGIFETIGFDKIKLFFVLIGLFFVMFVSSIKIVNSINNGIQTQKKADKMLADVTQLEKENKNLKFLDTRSKSPEEKESQIRDLEGKKKEGEILYVISSLSRDQKEIPKSNEEVVNVVEPSKPTLSNWEKWVQKVFN